MSGGEDRSLSNADLAPVPPADRTWRLRDFAALWVAMSVCIPTYMLASSMIAAGLDWWQSLLAILLGNAIVLVPMLVHAHAGARYGIPFPVLVRSSFGTRGAQVPSLLRSLIACGWFGIQTWIGGLAIHAIVTTFWPGFAELGSPVMGHSVSTFLSFGLFWLMNLYFVWRGTQSIRWLETLAAPFLLLMGLLLLAWAVRRGGGLAATLDATSGLVGDGAAASGGFLLGLFLPWLTAMVGFWATLALNIPDFSRYARSQRDQALGQSLGLLTTMPLFSFIGIVATGASLRLYGEAIWNPVDLLARITAESHSPLLGVLVMAALVLATLSTNLAANVVSPANSFANLAPQRIDFRRGGLIAGLIGVLIFPWLLLDRYQTWLISYSGLLGAVAGVMLCDYAILRRGELSLDDLYSSRGIYSYRNGIHHAAMIALAAGIAVALLGRVVPALRFLFSGAWFSASLVSGVVYYALAARSIRLPHPRQQATKGTA